MLDLPLNEGAENISMRYLVLKGQIAALRMVDLEAQRLIQRYVQYESEEDKKVKND